MSDQEYLEVLRESLKRSFTDLINKCTCNEQMHELERIHKEFYQNVMRTRGRYTQHT